MVIYPSISNRISKLGISIGTVNMPAVITCNRNCKGCYAQKGNFTFPKVKDGIMKNYEAYKADEDRFFSVLDNQLNMIPYRFFRWHSSGDIVDERYLEGMMWLARKHKGTNFLCFTKKYDIVNEYLNNHRKPKNLTLVLSAWGDLIPPNPHNLPTAWVEGIGFDELIPENAFKCHGNCGECVNTSEHCWKMQKGEAVYFHKH